MFRVVVDNGGSTTVEEDVVVDFDGLWLFALLNGHRRSCCLREANFAIVEEVVRSIIILLYCSIDNRYKEIQSANDAVGCRAIVEPHHTAL